MNLNLIVFVALTTLGCVAGAARILMIITDHDSRVGHFSDAARALKIAGHDVYSLVTPRHTPMLARKNLPYILFYHNVSDSVTYGKHMEKRLSDGKISWWKGIELASKILRYFVGQCEAVMGNQTLLNEIESYRFELVIIDGSQISRCFYLLPYRLSIPYITVTPFHDPWLAGLPTLPSGEGFHTKMAMSADSNIFLRLRSLLAYCIIYVFNAKVLTDNSLISKYASEKPKTSFDELYRKSEMWLMHMDPICMDYPRIYASHYRFIGGLSTKPGEPLTPDLEEYMQSSDDAGIIVVSFGSLLSTIPTKMLAKFFEAFAEIPQRVLMRFDGNTTLTVPSNVKLLPWLPQNDLLAHSKTRLFITHAGDNGQMEALYQGVPMLSMPFFADQPYNAQRSANRGFGITIDPYTFTSQELVRGIETMLKTLEYRKTIRHYSEIFRSFPSARQTVVFWVEHILKFGGSHLKPVYLDMPLWKIFMLDVLIVLAVLSTMLTFCCFYCCRYSLRRYTAITGPSKTKSE